MGLLSQLKIGAGKNENENRNKNIREQKAETQNSESGPAEITNPGGCGGPGKTKSAPPTVCGCGSVLSWRDIYGGGPHCHVCRPWPAERFILELIGYEPAFDSQAARWSVLWPLDGSADLSTADRASCGHSRTRRRTVWIPKDGVDRRTGKPILVADLDRVAEAEEFRECVLCGEWIPVSKSEVTE